MRIGTCLLLEMEEQMRVLKQGVAIVAISISIPLIVTAWAVDRAGGCGEYMYWKDGKCVDARNREREPWSEQMAKKKATW